jgi:hypothetical protein
MLCIQCNGDIAINDETIQYKVCKNFVQFACARASSSLLTRRKKPEKFTCKICAVKGSDNTPQDSNNSENADDDNIKLILLKMSQKNDELFEKMKAVDEIKTSCEFLNKKYDDFLEVQTQQQKIISELNKKVDDVTFDLKHKDVIFCNLTLRLQVLEQQQLATNKEIVGIPTKTGEHLKET